MPKETQPVPSTVKLKSRSKRPMLFNLPHEEYCVNTCYCTVSTRVLEEYDYRIKEHVSKVVERRLCSSVSWLPGETQELDLSIVRVKDILAAVTAGQLLKI